MTSRTLLLARPDSSANRTPRSKSRSSVGCAANASTHALPARLIASIFFGSRITDRVGISGPRTARRRFASTRNVRTSAWPGAPGFHRRSIPPSEAGTTSPRPVRHSTSVSWAIATSSARGVPRPSASSRANAVLRAAAALTPNPCETGRGDSLRILTSNEPPAKIFSATFRVTSAVSRLPFTRMSIEGLGASRTRATVWTPRPRQSPAPRDPFFRGSESSTTSKNAVTCPGQNASPSDTMEDRPPDPLRRERLRPLERVGLPFAVEDRHGGRVPFDLRDVVRDDEVDVGFLDEGHRPRLEVGTRHARFRLEADQDFLRALAEPFEELGRGLQLQRHATFPARDLAFLLFRGGEVR